MTDELKALLVVLLLILGVGFAIFATRRGPQYCLDTAGDRPCLPGTIEYEWEDGECECMTEHGELDWHIGTAGCG